MSKYSKEYTEKKIKAAAEVLSNRSITLDAYAYIKTYEVLESLYFQGDYDLAVDIADAVIRNAEPTA